MVSSDGVVMVSTPDKCANVSLKLDEPFGFQAANSLANGDRGNAHFPSDSIKN